MLVSGGHYTDEPNIEYEYSSELLIARPKSTCFEEPFEFLSPDLEATTLTGVTGGILAQSVNNDRICRVKPVVLYLMSFLGSMHVLYC